MMIATSGLLVISLLLEHATAETASSPTYCNPSAPHINHAPDPRFTPPIPCAGEYNPYKGICCSGKYDWIHGSCRSADSTAAWTLPLAPCVTQHPQWSGCPGNMMDGLCCSGPHVLGQRIERAAWRPAECLEGATAVFSVATGPDGTASTTTLPPGLRSVAAQLMGVGVVVAPDGSSSAFAVGYATDRNGHLVEVTSALTEGAGPTTTAAGPTAAVAGPSAAAKKAGSARTRAVGQMEVLSRVSVAGAFLALLLL
jgi:hypothetical protein